MKNKITKHAGGRQIKYREITLGNFGAEKDIEKYIYNNIKLLWYNIFEELVTKSQTQKRFGLFGPRIDLYIECRSGNKYIVEIKNPHIHSYSTILAIGQLLWYSTYFSDLHKLVIVSTKYNSGFKEILAKYNLPIEFILFAKNKVFLLQK